MIKPTIVAALMFAPAARATTISGTGAFDIFDVEGDVSTFVGDLAWDLHKSRVIDFLFVTDEGSWDEFDIGPTCQCETRPGGVVSVVLFAFDDGSDSWTLIFDFLHDNFGLLYDVSGVTHSGTSEFGSAFALGESRVFVVDEPAAALLFPLALLGLAIAGRK